MDKVSRKRDSSVQQGKGGFKNKKGKNMKAKFAGKCISCNKRFEVGSNIYYYFDIKMAKHAGCKKPDWVL